MPAKGCHQSEESKAKIAAAHRGMKRTPEQIERHAAMLRGRKNGPLSQETRDKIGAAHRGRKHTTEQIEKNRLGHLGQASARKGVTLSEETKQKVRDARAKQIHPQFAKKGITPEMVAEAAANGLKWCMGQCKAFLPLAEFYLNGEGKGRTCIKCSLWERGKRRLSLTPEEKAERAAANLKWRIENPVVVRDGWMKRKYGITNEWYERQLRLQDGHCALCDATAGWVRSNKKWHRNDEFLLVDHDHETGRVRGLLCAKCNTAIHRVEYVSAWAVNAMRYLSFHSSDRKTVGAMQEREFRLATIGSGVI